jgi:hypothetical protein
MAKKTLEQKIDSLTSIVEKGFAASDRKFGALAEDVADIRETMATKDQVFALQTQVNSIERHLRETRTEIRLGDLEPRIPHGPATHFGRRVAHEYCVKGARASRGLSPGLLRA